MYIRSFPYFSTEYHSHLNDVQSDLDALKDILRGDGYQFDPNSLINVSYLYTNNEKVSLKNF